MPFWKKPDFFAPLGFDLSSYAGGHRAKVTGAGVAEHLVRPGLPRCQRTHLPSYMQAQ